MFEEEDLLSLIKSQLFDIKYLADNTRKYKLKPRFKYFNIIKHINNFLSADKSYYNRLLMIPGLRGVGKSTLLYQVYSYLVHKKNIDTDNILI